MMTDNINKETVDLRQSESMFFLNSQEAEIPASTPVDLAYPLMPFYDDISELALHKPCWRLEIAGLPGGASIGFDLVGDIIMGRGEQAHIDLNSVQGAEKGVSRQHVILRITPVALYVIDLESTNGTRINGLPLGLNEARALTEDAIITLGRLTFTLKIIKKGTLKSVHTQPEAATLKPPVVSAIPAPDEHQTQVTNVKSQLGTDEEFVQWMSLRAKKAREFGKKLKS